MSGCETCSARGGGTSARFVFSGTHLCMGGRYIFMLSQKELLMTQLHSWYTYNCKLQIEMKMAEEFAL